MIPKKPAPHVMRSEKIMLHQKVERDGDLKKSHPGLVAALWAFGRRLASVVRRLR
jgi:hypothetical protein